METDLTLSGYQVILRPVTEDDLEMVRTWRNDPGVSQFMLSQEQITPEQQRAWFKKVSRDPRQQHYIIIYKDQPIGAANIRALQGTDLQNATVIEPGLYIFEDKYRANLLTFAPTLLLNDFCFNQLGVKTLRAVVKPDNEAALNYNAKLGYQVVRKGSLVEIELDQLSYEQASKPLKGLLSRPTTRKDNDVR